MLVTQQIPDRGRTSVPAPVAVGDGSVQLVEKAIAVVEHQHMAIAVARIRIALDLRIPRKRHRPRIAFGAVGCEGDVNRGLRSAHHRVRDPNRRTLILSRSKIGVHSDARPDEIDDGIRVRVYGRAGNILVPKVVAAKGTEPVEAGALSGAHRSAGALGVTARAARSGYCRQIRRCHPNYSAAAGATAAIDQVSWLPPPQFTHASANASAPVAASSLLQENFMPLLSQETAAKPRDVRPCPGQKRNFSLQLGLWERLSVLLPHQFHAPVAGAAGQRVIGFFGPGGAKTLRCEAVRSNVITSVQRQFHCLGAALG